MFILKQIKTTILVLSGVRANIGVYALADDRVLCYVQQSMYSYIIWHPNSAKPVYLICGYVSPRILHSLTFLSSDIVRALLEEFLLSGHQSRGSKPRPKFLFFQVSGYCLLTLQITFVARVIQDSVGIKKATRGDKHIQVFC